MGDGGKYCYLDLGAEPREDDLVCLFNVAPDGGVPLEKAADSIAAESSIGTWTEISTLDPSLRERLRARVIRISGNLVEIAYGAELFEGGNMAQVYSSVAGNIFGMKEVGALRLEAISFPPVLRDTFPGPSLGVAGIRKALGVEGRPVVGTIVKPKIGLPPKEHADVLFEALVSGCDVVKDDENLTSQAFCPFEARLKASLDAVRRAEDQTGEGKGYIPNITASTETMLRRAGQVSNAGGKFAMIDLITAGWSGAQTVRRAGLGLILHGHRAMHAAFTRSPDHGIAMPVIARCARLAGFDQLHVGTSLGKMAGGSEEVLKSASALRSTPSEGGRLSAGQEWGPIQSAMPIASGGLHPGHIPGLLALFGNDVILQFGGGIHGHPGGTGAGSRAVRQALVAALARTPLSKAAQGAPELAQAISKWGEA